MDRTTDHGQQVLDRIASLEIQRARIEAEIAFEMLAFADLRRRESERHADPRLRVLESDFAADELSVVVKEPTRTVQCRLAEARRVRGRLPLTWEAFAAGRIDERRMRLIASAVDKLTDNYSTITLDHWVVDYAATHTTAQLRAWLRRFVARNATDTRAARTEREKRSVWLSHQDDGMTFLSAYIPTPDAIRLDSELTRLAKAEPSDGRTLEQKRADVFARGMLSDGSSARATIGVLVPVTSLAGLDDEPGTSFDGQFAIPAAMVRELAAEPDTLVLPGVHRSSRPHPRRHRARPVPIAEAEDRHRHPRRHLPIRHLLASGHRVRRRSSDPASARPHEWGEHPLAVPAPPPDEDAPGPAIGRPSRPSARRDPGCLTPLRR